MNKNETQTQGKQMTYELIDNRGNDFGYVALTAADLVMAFSGEGGCSGCWSLGDHPGLPKNNPVFTLVSTFDKDGNLIERAGVHQHDVDSTLEELGKDVAKVVLSNDFDPAEVGYLLGGLYD